MRNNQGFSTLELIILIGVIGVPITFSLPSQGERFKSDQRALVMVKLTGMSQLLELEYGQNNSFAHAPTASFPTQWPVEGKALYSIKVDSINSSSYSLSATPMPGTIMAQDGKIEISSAGTKRWDRANNGFDAGDNCWKDSCRQYQL